MHDSKKAQKSDEKIRKTLHTKLKTEEPSKNLQLSKLLLKVQYPASIALSMLEQTL